MFCYLAWINAQHGLGDTGQEAAAERAGNRVHPADPGRRTTHDICCGPGDAAGGVAAHFAEGIVTAQAGPETRKGIGDAGFFGRYFFC